jgi:hypothetical protein
MHKGCGDDYEALRTSLFLHLSRHTAYSPSVAHMAIGFGDPLWDAEALAWLQAFLHAHRCRYGSCAWETFGSAGLLSGSPTCVQLPPFRLATTGW